MKTQVGSGISIIMIRIFHYDDYNYDHTTKKIFIKNNKSQLYPKTNTLKIYSYNHPNPYNLDY